jgi:hypothetical protein
LIDFLPLSVEFVIQAPGLETWLFAIFAILFFYFFNLYLNSFLNFRGYPE